MRRKFAIVDLETTGGIPKRDKITEIAIIVHDGESVIDEFQSLVNPERSIPPEITRITGITNEMVSEAPKFYEIAREVIEKTEECIFVAHNVRFDYSFLIHEFKSLGYTFTRRNLCTVRLSRKAFPGLRSYSLGNLIRHFNIEVQNRHRAYDDAYATTLLLEKIFREQNTKKALDAIVRDGIKLTRLPKTLDPEIVFRLPEKCGIYYFMDGEGDILYVGKSINIQKRVKQHFSGRSSKTDRLFQPVVDIQYEIYGSELYALVAESYEIKKHQPPINKIQKSANFKYALTSSRDKSGYMRYEVKRNNEEIEAINFYGSRKAAYNHIEQLSELFQLCLKVNKLDTRQLACFNYELGKCKGACIGEEPAFQYNERFIESLNSANSLFSENFLVIDQGRTDDEASVLMVHEGHFRSAGHLSNSNGITEATALIDQLTPSPVNPEADLIIRNYIWSHPELKLIYY